MEYFSEFLLSGNYQVFLVCKENWNRFILIQHFILEIKSFLLGSVYTGDYLNIYFLNSSEAVILKLFGF